MKNFLKKISQGELLNSKLIKHINKMCSWVRKGLASTRKGVLEKGKLLNQKWVIQENYKHPKLNLNPDGSLYSLLNISCSIQRYGRRARYYTEVTLKTVGRNK